MKFFCKNRTKDKDEGLILNGNRKNRRRLLKVKQRFFKLKNWIQNFFGSNPIYGSTNYSSVLLIATIPNGSPKSMTLLNEFCALTKVAYSIFLDFLLVIAQKFKVLTTPLIKMIVNEPVVSVAATVLLIALFNFNEGIKLMTKDYKFGKILVLTICILTLIILIDFIYRHNILSKYLNILILLLRWLYRSLFFWLPSKLELESMDVGDATLDIPRSALPTQVTHRPTGTTWPKALFTVMFTCVCHQILLKYYHKRVYGDLPTFVVTTWRQLSDTASPVLDRIDEIFR